MHTFLQTESVVSTQTSAQVNDFGKHVGNKVKVKYGCKVWWKRSMIIKKAVYDGLCVLLTATSCRLARNS